MINNKHIRGLYAGADAGHYDLPAKLLALRPLAASLPYPPLPEPRVPNWLDLAADNAGRLVRGDDAPETVAELVQAGERDHAAWVIDSQYRAELGRRAEVEIVEAFNGAYADLIKALQPAHTATVAGLVKVAKVLPEDASAEMVIASDSGPMRDAWQTLAKLSQRYAAIRNASQAVRQPLVEWDELGEFSEFRNMTKLWPTFGKGLRGQENHAPWTGLDPANRLLWLVHRGAEFWLPTVAERDAAWWKAYGAGVERQRANAWNAESYKGAMGGSGAAGDRPTRHPRDVIAGRPYGDAA